MGTLVFAFLFLAVASRRPDLALVIYFLNWAFCRAMDRPTVFDRCEAWLRRLGKAMAESGEGR